MWPFPVSFVELPQALFHLCQLDCPLGWDDAAAGAAVCTLCEGNGYMERLENQQCGSKLRKGQFNMEARRIQLNTAQDFKAKIYPKGAVWLSGAQILRSRCDFLHCDSGL